MPDDGTPTTQGPGSAPPGEPGPDAGTAAPTAAPEQQAPSRPNWWFVAAGVSTVGASLWSFATAWTGLTGSHPIGWITNVVAAVGGIGLLLAGSRTGTDRPRARGRRWAARIAVTSTAVLLAGVVVYTRPLSAEQVALDALHDRDGSGVEVVDGATSLRLQPTSPTGSGLVFYPGAKVDPRAYTRLLRPLAEAGHPVVVVKQPYNLAVLGVDAADRWIGDPDDETDRWVIGGHSLGGAMAASYASDERPELVGLLLYAAYPATDLSDRDLAVASVSGTRDGLSTPDDIARSAADLPATTEFVAIEGARHADFGDYGSQRGDGEATIDHETAQRAIVAATRAFFEHLDADD